jgi:LPXTG-motif cell wall-anchored protein
MTNTKIPVVPDTPVTPKPPVIPDTPSSSSPKTGDDSNVSFWLVTICMALGVSMFTLKKKNIKEKFEYENNKKN